MKKPGANFKLKRRNPVAKAARQNRGGCHSSHNSRQSDKRNWMDEWQYEVWELVEGESCPMVERGDERSPHVKREKAVQMSR